MSGIIYGFRIALSSGEGDFIYYFGRTRSSVLLRQSRTIEDAARPETAADHVLLNSRMCLMLRRCGRVGLNSAGRIVLWRRSANVMQDFSLFLERLFAKNWLRSEPHIGKHWFSSDLSSFQIQNRVQSTYENLIGVSAELEPDCFALVENGA